VKETIGFLKFVRRGRSRLVRRWRLFWLRRSSLRFRGRIAAWLAGIGVGRYRRQCDLAWMTPKGYVSPDAEIHAEVRMGRNVFVGAGCAIIRTSGDGLVDLHDGAQIFRDCTMEMFEGGGITIGEQAGLQRGCVLASAIHPIMIGRRAAIAPYCTFFSYDHGIEDGREIFGQPLISKGPIIIGEDAWLGTGVSVMSGVRIGNGAVVGAGSVVVGDIPDHAIAVGVPARVIRYRDGTPRDASRQG
jgi:acetyltransferase-like isoleucine patch superfamily enzyme